MATTHALHPYCGAASRATHRIRHPFCARGCPGCRPPRGCGPPARRFQCYVHPKVCVTNEPRPGPESQTPRKGPARLRRVLRTPRFFVSKRLLNQRTGASHASCQCGGNGGVDRVCGGRWCRGECDSSAGGGRVGCLAGGHESSVRVRFSTRLVEPEPKANPATDRYVALPTVQEHTVVLWAAPVSRSPL